MCRIDGAPQRLGPEARRSIHIVGVAVDQHGAEAGMMHVGLAQCFAWRERDGDGLVMLYDRWAVQLISHS